MREFVKDFVMKVSYIGYNTYHLPKKNVYTSRPVSMPVSFKHKNYGDKYIAEEYYRSFANLIDRRLENDTKNRAETYNFDYKSFFDDLNNETESVINHFILSRNGTDESPFSLSIISQNSNIAQKVLELVEDSNAETIWKFLVPDKNKLNGPLLTSLGYDNTEKTAAQILKIIKLLPKEKQAEYYYRQSRNLMGENTDILTELRNCGYAQTTQEIAANIYNFELSHPHLASQYKNSAKNPQNFNRTPKTDNLKQEEIKEDKQSNFKVYTHVKTRFSDVGGMFNVKQQIQEELLNILNNPKVKNSDKPSGIILYGPPGTGKTLLATAIAGEAKVPFISANGSSFNEIYVGSGAKNVRELYSLARNLAKTSPSNTAIVFIDEADAVAVKRGGSSNRENDNTLNALLSELDGVQSKEESDIKVITIFATNRKDLFDSAFRKGRIDMEFKIDDPRFSEKARREILSINAKDKPFKSEKIKNKILDELAKTSAGMSGAELADVIKRAYRKTLYKDRQTPYITEKDITDAKLEAIIGAKNDGEKTDYELKMVRAHEAGHAINQIVINRVFKDEAQKSKMPMQTLDFIVNESRGNAAGLTMMKPTENHRITIESLLAHLIVNYGGYSVEEKLFDCHTDGVSSDLQNSTDLIMQSVTQWGLGSKTKYIGCDPGGVTFELFKPDIKNDLIRYSNTGMAISEMITEFTEPFIKEYVDKLTSGPLEKASIITGEKFEKMFDEWLTKNNAHKDFEDLSKKIRDNMTAFKKEMK